MNRERSAGKPSCSTARRFSPQSPSPLAGEPAGRGYRSSARGAAGVLSPRRRVRLLEALAARRAPPLKSSKVAWPRPPPHRRIQTRCPLVGPDFLPIQTARTHARPRQDHGLVEERHVRTAARRLANLRERPEPPHWKRLPAKARRCVGCSIRSACRSEPSAGTHRGQAAPARWHVIHHRGRRSSGRVAPTAFRRRRHWKRAAWRVRLVAPRPRHPFFAICPLCRDLQARL